MSKFLKLFGGICLLLTLMTPVLVDAQGALPGNTQGTGGGASSSNRFTNPLGNITSPVPFLMRVIGFLLGLVGLLALLAIITGGIRMIAAFGREQEIANAKKMIFWAIAGLVITVLSWVIVDLIAKQLLGAV